MVYRYSSHWKFILMNFFGLVASCENVVIAVIVGTLTTFATRHEFGQLPEFLVGAAIAMVLTLVAQVLFNYLKTAAIRQTNQVLRARVFTGMLNSGSEPDSSALGFLTNDFKLLETNRFGAEISILLYVYQLVFALGYALYLNWLITLIFLVGSGVPMVLSNVFQPGIQRASKGWSAQNERYVSQTKNFLAGTGTFYLYHQQENAAAKNRQSISRLEAALAKMNVLNLNANAYINTMAMLSAFLMPFLVGTYLVIRGQTTLGTLFAIVQLSNSFVNPIMNILGQRNNLSTTKGIVDRVNGYLHAADQVASTPANPVQTLQVQGITLTRQNQELARGIDLSVTQGQKVAVIGRSGSGKSTLLQFLMYGKFGAAQQRLLNHQVVPQTTLTDLFAYASQQAVIFADTLKFNLTLGVEIPAERIRAVCAGLDLSDLVAEKGLDYQLGANADQLSGGQLERIELARAILSKRPILLLDEITASLDKQTAAQVHAYLMDSRATCIEVIHHYEPDELQRYDQVIDFDQLAK